MKHGALELLILALAAFRLTHLVVFDGIAEPLRIALQNRPFIGDLVACYWCAGIWISAGLVTGLAFWPALFQWVLLVLAVAGVQALIELSVQACRQEKGPGA